MKLMICLIVLLSFSCLSSSWAQRIIPQDESYYSYNYPWVTVPFGHYIQYVPPATTAFPNSTLTAGLSWFGGSFGNGTRLGTAECVPITWTTDCACSFSWGFPDPMPATSPNGATLSCAANTFPMTTVWCTDPAGCTVLGYNKLYSSNCWSFGSCTANNYNPCGNGFQSSVQLLPVTTTSSASTTTTSSTTTSSASSTSSTLNFTSPTTTSSLPTTTGSTTATLPSTSLPSTTTTLSSLPFQDICSGIECVDIIFPDPRPSSPSNTTVVVGNNTISVDTFNNATRFVYSYSWGDIYEADSSLPHPVKGIDLNLLDWERSTFSNSSHVLVTFRALASFDEWATHPILIIFEATFSWQGNTTQSLKTSLSILGDWQFEQPTNTLHVGMVLSGEFGTDNCGRSSQVFNSSDESEVFELYAPNHTITFLELLKYCYLDGSSVAQPAFITSPSLFNQTIFVNLTFPSFKQRLDYDPNMAVLLGGGLNKECKDSMFVWILPVGFLGGAAVVIILVSILGLSPWLAPYFLGYEAVRVHKLRGFIKENSEEIAKGNRPMSERPMPVEEDW